MATAINKLLNGIALKTIQHEFNLLLVAIKPFAWFSNTVQTATPLKEDGIWGASTADGFANLFGGKIPTVEAWKTYYLSASTKLSADKINATQKINDAANSIAAGGKVESKGVSFMDVVKVALFPAIGPAIFILHPSAKKKVKSATNDMVIDDSTASVPTPNGAASATVSDNNGFMLMGGLGLLAFGLISKFTGNGGKK